MFSSYIQAYFKASFAIFGQLLLSGYQLTAGGWMQAFYIIHNISKSINANIDRTINVPNNWVIIIKR